MSHNAPMIPFRPYIPPVPPEEAARGFYEIMNQRRTVRMFSDRPVSRETIESIVRAAGSAPSGANKQPWRFVAVSNPDLKSKIRVAAEEEEREFYHRRVSDEWRADLQPFATDEHKPFLEKAPYLIVIMAESYELDEEGTKSKNYYVTESVGIATGMLITAVHRAGLVSLTHTPSPMGFLKQIVGRPKNERAFLILVVGYPEEGAEVPDISKKSIDQIATFME